MAHGERMPWYPSVRIFRQARGADWGPVISDVRRELAALLAKAGVNSEAVDTVFFTGGASGVPLLRERIAALLPQARRIEGDLFGSIGAGLAVEAQRRFG